MLFFNSSCSVFDVRTCTCFLLKLQKTRKVLAQKIEQLNSAIDEVSSQLRTEDSPNGVAVNSDEVEPAI